MAKIGLAYSKEQMKQFLKPKKGQKGTLIGLVIFPEPAPYQNLEILKIKQVYFNASTPRFTFNAIPDAAPIALYKENAAFNRLEEHNGELTAYDHLEFLNVYKIDLCFFPQDSLQILLSLSNRLIFCGGSMQIGAVAASGEPTEKMYVTLVVETDPKDTTRPASGSAPMPTMIQGMPCPPYWET